MRVSPHALENLYHHLGEPAWFWPVVLVFILVLIGLGSMGAPA